MNPSSWKRVEPVVDELLDLVDAERRERLDRLAEADPDLAAQVAEFLAAERRAGAFLAASVEERAPALLACIAEDAGEWDEPADPAIGPYRATRRIGRGGMGAVFLAQRRDGQFEQEVAIKLVKRGMDSAEILERFRAERQILARLQHPNIARLLDGGITTDGRPYLAMEYVEGVPLGAHCEGRPVAERLRLFLQVCDAVDYAHRNLVVHRDLKPSNILVTRDGQAKLLDFGIAKVLDPAGEGAATTRPEMRAWTPRYAAPEQLTGQPVTTATDVYSLGVVLYELLAGRHPYAEADMGAAEVARAALRADPPPLAGLGDLDSIARTALSVEPDRRYGSVRALAGDIRNCMAGLPVSARADRLSYRVSKFVSRHRIAVAAAGLVAVAVVAGGVATLWQAQRAIALARKADAVHRFTVGLFQVADPDAARGREITARELLERGAEKINAELADQPATQAEMLLVIGEIQHRLGLERESRPLFERALRLRREIFDEDDARVLEAEQAVGGAYWMEGDRDRAEAILTGVLEKRRRRGGDPLAAAQAASWLGRIRAEKGDSAGAETLLRAAIAEQRRHQPSSGAELALSLTELGFVRQGEGDWRGAESLHQEALAIRRGLFGDLHTSVADTLSSLARVTEERGDQAGAEARYRQALAIDRKLLGPSHLGLATDLNNLGVAVLGQGRHLEAEPMLRESLDIRRAAYGPDSPQLAVALHNLARSLRPQGRLDEAESLSRRALGLAVASHGEEHVHVASVREELARTLGEKGQSAEAETSARHALKTYREKLPPGHPRTADALVTLGRLLLADGRAGEAEPILREAFQIRQDRFGRAHARTAEAEAELDRCLRAQRGPAIRPGR